MLIYDALKKDHEKVKKLLNELVGLEDDSPRKSGLIKKIRDELIPHARAEESVFYNSLRAMETGKKSEVMHGYREHMEAETYLRTLQVMGMMDTGWKKIARQLKKAVEHHIKEEEGKIFAIARENLSEDEASDMAVAFKRMKEEIKDESAVKTTMKMVANLMPPRFSKPFRSSGISARY